MERLDGIPIWRRETFGRIKNGNNGLDFPSRVLPAVFAQAIVLLGVLVCGVYVDVGCMMVLVDVDLRAIRPIEAVVLLTGGSAG